jgi:hypothetical protein
VLAIAASILAGTSLLIRSTTVAFPPVAFRRRGSVTFAAVLSGTPVAPGTPVTA